MAYVIGSQQSLHIAQHYTLLQLLDIANTASYPSKEGTMMLTKYLETAVKKAEYKRLDDETWFELIEVLEEWILLKTRDHEDIPVIEDIDINVKPASI